MRTNLCDIGGHVYQSLLFGTATHWLVNLGLHNDLMANAAVVANPAQNVYIIWSLVCLECCDHIMLTWHFDHLMDMLSVW